ncbi:hypothetical protein PDIDSM_5387 [Penicillium digitatum]|nr:hypothetical protein PDIDSM_5387 [Penicillium digitatum]
MRRASGPSKSYGKLEGCENILGHRLKYGKSLVFNIRIVVSTITEEVLPEIVQREQAIKIKARLSEKGATNKQEEAHYDEELRDILQEYGTAKKKN